MMGTAGGTGIVTVGNVTVDLEGTTGGNLSYSSLVQAVVDVTGVTDFLHERFYPMNRDPDAAGSFEGVLLGGSIQDRPELSATANPVWYVTTDDPPFLLMHGTLDETSPLSQSALLADALEDRGVPVDFRIVPGATHSESHFNTASHLTAIYGFLADALTAPAAAGAAPRAPAPSAGGVSLMAEDAAADESGDRGRFRLTRSSVDVASPLRLFYTVGGTAGASRDYVALSGVVTIPAGAASGTIDILPVEDDLRESTEIVTLTLVAGSDYAVGSPHTAGVLIRDNDNEPSRPTVSVVSSDRVASEAPGNGGAFIVSRTGSTAAPLTVPLVVGGNATPGVDYRRLPSTVTFAAGVRRITLSIAPISDALSEGDEFVSLKAGQYGDSYAGPYTARVRVADYAPPPAPVGWQSTDIGGVGAVGFSSGNSGAYTVAGGGADVWGAADGLHLLSQSMTGNAVITARVASVSGPDAWTKVGVMIRASAGASAQHAFMLVSLGKGLAFQRRTTTGGASASTAADAGTAPRWVRLVRDGNVITAFVSTDGATWTLVGRETFSMPATVLAGLAVSSHEAGTLAVGRFTNVTIAPLQPAGSLPAGWASADIGVVGRAGSVTVTGGTAVVRGAGADVWGRSDAFHFVYRTLAGNGGISARIASVSGTQAWTKVGVMIRETLSPGAAHAFVLVSAGKGAAFQRRITPNGESRHTSAGLRVAPHWVKVARSGNIISAWVSVDGVAWSLVAEDTFAVGPSVLVGLAVSSHDTSALATGTFDQVAVTP
jgi:regulation of enolase protein 1 (concanavalin A-like superfamily)